MQSKVSFPVVVAMLPPGHPPPEDYQPGGDREVTLPLLPGLALKKAKQFNDLQNEFLKNVT